jgi:hypothetical protein
MTATTPLASRRPRLLLLLLLTSAPPIFVAVVVIATATSAWAIQTFQGGRRGRRRRYDERLMGSIVPFLSSSLLAY